MTQADLPQGVFRHWIHSREEDADGLEVFRPEGFAFPPSFGRDGFEMQADGTFIQDDIGPADGVVQVPGRWQLIAPRRVAVSFDDAEGRPGYAFEIVTVDDAVLKTRRSASYLSLPPVDEGQLQAYSSLPPAVSARRIDFTDASLVTLRTFPPRHILRVSGTKPYADMRVELVPLVYIRQPEYWEVEVVGSLRGAGLAGPAPYTESLEVTATIGTRGLQVVGASTAERFDVPRPAPDRCEWQAWVDRQPPGPATLHVVGECEFPSGGFTVGLSKHTPQGFNPRDLLLDKTVTPPDGPATTVITKVEVRYSEETETGYDTVSILPDGVTIPVTEAV
jgi:hypothetical protein